MPNYLQRIIISGARTTSPAKPPAFSRPLMPPVTAPVWAPMGEAGSQPMEGFSDLDLHVRPLTPARETPSPSEAEDGPALREPEVFRAGDVPPPIVLPREQPPHKQTCDRPATAAESNVPHQAVSAKAGPTPSSGPLRPGVSIPPAVGTLIQAPKGLRRIGPGSERQAVMVQAIEQTLQTFALRATGIPAKSGTVIPAAPKDHSLPPPAESTIQGVAIQAAQEAARVQVPPATTTPKVELPTSREQLEPSSRQRENEKTASPESRPVVDRQNRDAHSFEVRPTPPRQARPAVPGLTENQRRSQISIGRIDVQVNNLPAIDSASPPPARPATHSNFLEVRY